MLVISIALSIASSIPIFFLWGLRRFNFYKTGKFAYNFMTLFWGWIAYLIAARINVSLLNNDIVTHDELVRFVAPVLEEILKGLIIFYLIRRADFYFVVDGVIYGFGAGIGFAVVENWEYILANPDTALPLAIVRVFSTNLVHATGSALIGTFLGAFRFEKIHRFLAFLLMGLTLAMGTHMLFNNVVNSGNGLLMLIVAIVIGLSGFGAMYIVIKRNLNAEKEKIKTLIPKDISITSSEALIINQLDVVQKLLQPFRMEYGNEKAEIAEKFLTKQAHLTMSRRNLASAADDPSMRKGIEDRIAKLTAEINEMRNNIGAYGMMYLRTVFPANDNPVLDLIASRIAAEAARNKGKAGTGSWNRVAIRKPQTPTAAEPKND